MGKITAYTDKKGTLHPTAEKAAISDLMSMLGANAEGVAHGIAVTLFQKRAELEAIFAEYDSCVELADIEGDA